MNDLARVVKEADPDHPVIAVLAGAGGGKLDELRERCPALDAVGINAYGGMMSLPETIAASGWKKPYIVTEFGPRGHWEVAKTPWGLPIEDTSTEKADFYLKAYRHAIDDTAAVPGLLRLPVGPEAGEDAHLVRHVPAGRQPRWERWTP